MSFPIAVRASFILTGMLGLRLEGINNGNGSVSVVETSVPFNLAQGNQPIVPNMPPVNRNPKQLGDFNSPGITTITQSPNKTESLTLIERKNDTEIKITCGPGLCNNGEMCVTWIKEKSDSTRRNRESPMMVHECLLNDGNHYDKMDPSSMKLCGKDEVHSIIKEPQPCLRDSPPCSLVWKYKCGKAAETKMAHSCKLRSCPSGSSCAEFIACDLEPPCVTKTLCSVGGRSLEPQ